MCSDQKTDRRFNAECHEQKSQQTSHTAQMLTCMSKKSQQSSHTAQMLIYMSKKVSKITIRPKC